MDPILASAGTALVGLMVTEAWGQAREGVVALWRRVRPADADAVGRDLDEARAELVEARTEGDDGDATERELVGEWQRRLLRVLRDDPAAADELRRVLEEAGRAAGATEPPSAGVHLQARAEGHAQIYQAGRDLRVQKP
ncbi:hypothetical protein FCH28_25755 [Streptomyces piniterrae]|uniref:CchlP n=1 Tax=Streptomyces piniterrae TaxID=2571125 RepID=A0A4V5MJK3_9ACTN|nr:hypothetical protein [Streptomyces piniterrae]TJZ49678.1 hypothetical protein FCH28_25755 [Streptomyces piniterrae]